MSVLDVLCREDDPPARSRAAKALLTLLPSPHSEREFLASARSVAEEWTFLERLASQVPASDNYSLRGDLQEQPVAALLIEIGQHGLQTSVGAGARRYLCALLLEILVARLAAPQERSVRVLARTLRLELEALRRNPTSRPPLPNWAALIDAVVWLDTQPQASTRFTGEFWSHWRRISELAWKILSDSSDADLERTETYEEVEYIVSGPTNEGEVPPPPGWIAPPPSKELRLPPSPGTEQTLWRSTYTPLRQLTTGALSAVTDSDIQSEVERLLGMLSEPIEPNRFRMEAAAARLLALASASRPERMMDLKWGSACDVATFPGNISLSAEWLFRPQLAPDREGHERTVAKQGDEVWIPIPPTVKHQLAKLCPEPITGSYVFPVLRARISTLESDPESLSPTSIKRALISRLARCEPLGLTGAIWAAGDDLGLPNAQLFYDRYSADRLAALIERITFPWFGDRPGLPRKERPRHWLGSEVIVSPRECKSFYGASFGEPLDEDPTGALVARVHARTGNLVRGLVAITGHRPNNSIGALTRRNFSLDEPIGVIFDKEVSPDWQQRPVALPAVWRQEFARLLCDLQEVTTDLASTPLGAAAARAITGDGPVFLSITNVNDVRPFDRSDYLDGAPPIASSRANFARHALNQWLTGRVPEALRVAQLGWHGEREGAWADGSPWSVHTAAQQLERPLAQYLKEIGWKPLPARHDFRNTAISCDLEWLARGEQHERRFRGQLCNWRRHWAQKQAAIAKELQPRIQRAVEVQWPSLTLEGFRIESRPDATLPVVITSDELKKLERLAVGTNSQQELRAVRNLLSAMFRRANGKGVVKGPVPRRIHPWFPNQSGPFLREAPLAIDSWNALAKWIDSAECTLSDSARTLIAVLLHGGYADADATRRAMAPGAVLRRIRSKPHVLLVEPAAEVGENDGPRFGHTLAYHGVAALHLYRWHRQRRGPEIDLGAIEQEVSAALAQFLPSVSSGKTLEELEALARVHNLLRMDGIARLVGTGQVQPVSVGSGQIMAMQDALPAYPRLPDRNANAALVQVRAQAVSSRNIEALLKMVNEATSGSRPDRTNEAEATGALRSQLQQWILGVAANPTVVDLLARYVISLLDHGGHRKSVLKLASIRNYLLVIAWPLKRQLGSNPLSLSSDAWQQAFGNIIASASPDMRLNRYLGLQRFHSRLGQEIELPDVDFAVLAPVAGWSRQFVDAGFITLHEARACHAALIRDVHELSATNADPTEIHLARARELFFVLMLSGRLRTGEVWGLRLGDITLSNSRAYVRVRSSSLQSLKTPNARRRILLGGAWGEMAQSILSSWISAVHALAGKQAVHNVPLFFQVDDLSTRLPRDEITSRVGFLVRWATGSPDAIPYWLRKSGVHRAFQMVQSGTPNSLWPMRDFLAETGHADLRTTIGSYAHDPLLYFAKFFDCEPADQSASRIAIAVGKSCSRVSRAPAGGVLKGHRAGAWSERIALLLRKVPGPVGEAGFTEFPSVALSAGQFQPSCDDLDSLLREVARGSALVDVARHRAWPFATTVRLSSALESLQADHGVILGATTSAPTGQLLIRAPRRLSNVSEVSLALSSAEASVENIIVEMAGEWLRLHAMPGVPMGIPGRPSQWQKWEKEIPALGQWAIQTWRNFELRTPHGVAREKPRGWQMVRWMLLLNWLRFRMESVGT